MNAYSWWIERSTGRQLLVVGDLKAEDAQKIFIENEEGILVEYEIRLVHWELPGAGVYTIMVAVLTDVYRDIIPSYASDIYLKYTANRIKITFKNGTTIAFEPKRFGENIRMDFSYENVWCIPTNLYTVDKCLETSDWGNSYCVLIIKNILSSINRGYLIEINGDNTRLVKVAHGGWPRRRRVSDVINWTFLCEPGSLVCDTADESEFRYTYKDKKFREITDHVKIRNIVSAVDIKFPEIVIVS